jgi:hypothetical protein
MSVQDWAIATRLSSEATVWCLYELCYLFLLGPSWASFGVLLRANVVTLIRPHFVGLGARNQELVRSWTRNPLRMELDGSLLPENSTILGLQISLPVSGRHTKIKNPSPGKMLFRTGDQPYAVQWHTGQASFCVGK